MASEAQVVIVGSGVAGSLIARTLLGAGYSDVVMLEAGPPVPMADYRRWLDLVTTRSVPYGHLHDTAQDYTASGGEPWRITGGRLLGRGGSTIHWGGWCPRFMPEDFRLRSSTGRGIDWLYGYDDLEPFYVEAERYLRVSGVAFAGQRDWRSAPYPLPAAPLPLTAAPLQEALQALEIPWQHMPMARNTIAVDGHAQCLTTGTCDYCPFGARFTGDQPLDALEGTAGFALLTNAPAVRILTSSKAAASGVQYLDPSDGSTKTIGAGSVVLCAGALETPKLLLASANRHWPEGIGNDHDLVGRHLVSKPWIYARGSAEDNPQRLQQELGFATLCTRHWDSPAEQADGKFLMNMAIETPLLDPAVMMYEGQSAATIDAAATGALTYELQGGIAPMSHYQNRVTLASGTTRFGLPRTRIAAPQRMVSEDTVERQVTRMHHIFEAMGLSPRGGGGYPQRGDHSASTCRMAATPDQGVVDGSLLVHGMSNLMIASNAVMPNVGAANPTLTLVALIMKVMSDNPLPKA